MDEPYSTDWWLWQMYRQVAQFINSPSEITESQLRSLILEYRNFHQQHELGLLAPRGRSVDFG